MAHIGIGMAKGDEKAIEAVKLAVASPLLETTITGASHVIINISGDISLMDANDAASYVQDLAGDNANIIFGAKYDETMTDEATITVIATGLETKPSSSKIMPDLKYQTPPTVSRPVNSGFTARPQVNPTPVQNTVPTQQTAPTTPLNGIQKPVKPVSNVPEKDIQIPAFLKNTRK